MKMKEVLELLKLYKEAESHGSVYFPIYDGVKLMGEMQFKPELFQMRISIGDKGIFIPGEALESIRKSLNDFLGE